MIPWPNSTPVPSTSTHTQPQSLHTRTFLSDARTQLDADHFGLEKVKKRLIEYLAVVRLKEVNAEREREHELAQVKGEAEAKPEVKLEKENKDGKKIQEKKDTDAQSQAPLPLQLQFGVPGASNGKPKQHSRLGKKGVKGPILLYASPSSSLPFHQLTPYFPHTASSAPQAQAKPPSANPSPVPSTAHSSASRSVACVTKQK